MATKRSFSLQEEELLCEKIRSFPVLYDKSHKGYKEKVAVENAWNEVAKEVDFVENGKICVLNLFLMIVNYPRNY